MVEDDSVVVQTRDLTKKYGKQIAVDHLSFTLREGEIFGFLGPNGAGKTTTLLMLMGLTRPSSGEAVVCGLDPVRRARDVKSIIGYMPENVGFYPELDAVESLDYIAALNGIPQADARRKIDKLLELVGLKDDAYKKVGNYSRGMKQRLGIAEVLIKDPKVLFLDEPTLGLDPEAALNLIDLIIRLKEEHNMTVLLCSHDLHQVQRMSDRVGIMINGRMVAQGSLDQLSKEKFGLEDKKYSLEEIYLRYFREA